MGVAILGVMPVSVAIVNDYEVVVRGLAGMFGHYADRVRVVELVANRPVGEPVDIALYDTFAQGQADAKRVTQLIADHDVRRVAVYVELLPAMARTALRSSASGYLSKSLSARDLVECLEAIHAGGWVVRPHRAPPRSSAASGPVGRRADRPRVRDALPHHTGTVERSHRRARGPVEEFREVLHPWRLPEDPGDQPLAGRALGVRHGLQPDSMRVPVSRDSDTA